MIALKAKAYRSDEEFGYDRWCASQITCGRGTHPAIITIFVDETERALWLKSHGMSMSTKWDAAPGEEQVI